MYYRDNRPIGVAGWMLILTTLFVVGWGMLQAAGILPVR